MTADSPLDFEPKLGLGTMGIEDPDSIAAAIEMGYRHLDTAQIYENERVVGDGVERADVPREDISLATKVWADSLAHDDVLSSTRESLDKLGVGYVDLLYVHRPIETYDPESTLTAFDELHDEGRIRGVAVSNFSVEQVAEARDLLDTPLLANQVEMHPFYQQEELLANAEKHDYTLVAYSPLAQGEVFENETMQGIAEKHDATPAQVSLAWLAGKKSVVPIPRSASEIHLRQNLAALDLELDAEDVTEIESIEREQKLFE